MSAQIQRASINQIALINQRETIAANCGYVPITMLNCDDSILVGEQFIKKPGTDHGLRVQCFECNIGSLWKLGMKPLDNIQTALCSNDCCHAYLPLKIHMEEVRER